MRHAIAKRCARAQLWQAPYGLARAAEKQNPNIGNLKTCKIVSDIIPRIFPSAPNALRIEGQLRSLVHLVPECVQPSSIPCILEATAPHL